MLPPVSLLFLDVFRNGQAFHHFPDDGLRFAFLYFRKGLIERLALWLLNK